MDSIKKANLLVIFIVAILGFGMSNIVAILTEEYVNLEMPNINESQKLIAVNDGNFSPHHINTVVVENTTNITNDTPTNNNSNTNIVNESNETLFEDLLTIN